MPDDVLVRGEEAFDTESGCPVWWDGEGWSRDRLALPLGRRERPAHLPVSFAQSRLWFLHQVDPRNTAYNIVQAMRIRGPLQARVLEQAVNEIVRRHESLRTRFVEIDGVPYQVVDSELKVLVACSDLRAMPAAGREDAISAAASRAADGQFDLEKGPLLRAQLLLLGEMDHALVVTLHHIISDGWSSGIFSTELERLYAALAEGSVIPLDPLPVQYADFTLWQRERAESGALAAGVDYWKRQLAGMPARLQLPSDHLGGPMQMFAGGLCTAHVPAEKIDGLRRIVQGSQATLYMGLLAVFALLLERHTGQQDIVIGSPIANRSEPQLEGLIGFFVNSLVMRVRLDPQLTFRQLLVQVQRTTLEAYDFQDVPFERLVAELSPDRDLNLTPLFQVLFALQRVPVKTRQMGQLSIEPVTLKEGQAHFDLHVQVEENETGLRIFWLYNGDLFARWRMERMLGHFLRLIEEVARTPDTRLDEIDVLLPAERREVLEEFNQTRRKIAPGTLPQMFEAMAAAVQDRVALVCGEERWSFHALNMAANRLAHVLVSNGAGPGEFVGVCMGRTADLLATLYAVLKTGAAYLPLDPQYPDARLTAMVEDARPLLVIGTKDQRHRFEGLCSFLALDESGVRETVEHAPVHNMADAERTTALLAEHPAYIIYTSGSTGRPKGVVVAHRSLVTLSAWVDDLFTEEDWTGILASTSICFDPSAFELLLTPIHGGTIILAETAVSLHGLPARGGVRLINTVPSAARALLEMDGIPDTVRTINLLGEKLPGDLVADLYALPGIERVFNLYGPTEDTVWSTGRLCDRGTASDPDIGKPMWNTSAYVLDARLRPVPVGVEGDLYLAGEGLAHAYWRRPSLTAERFPADPFGLPGTRMYRTGDRASWKRNGTIEYLGRSDHQVKIRGFRIEPGEIEARLGTLPGVAQQVVIAREDPGMGKQLVAYVVPTAGVTLQSVELREALALDLPDHMVPSAIVVLEALPLTSNGKLDRARLPAPHARSEAGTTVQAVSSMQALVMSVWRDVLGPRPVGPEDNFFDVGGDSLSLVTVLSHLRRRVSPQLTVVDLFRYPRVSVLAAFLEQMQGAESVRSATNDFAERARKQRDAAQRAMKSRAALDRVTPGRQL